MRTTVARDIWRTWRMYRTQITLSRPGCCIRVRARSASNKNRNDPMDNVSQYTLVGLGSIIIGSSLLYILYQNDLLQPLPPTRLRNEIRKDRESKRAAIQIQEELADKNFDYLSALPFQSETSNLTAIEDESAWDSFTNKFAAFSTMANSHWTSVTNTIADFVIPEWAKILPENISKLQKELSMAPGSLADEIWKEAQDPNINPEIARPAEVRVSADLCDEEKNFLKQRKEFTKKALAKYLSIAEEEIHPDDVPIIAMVGSGGGLRAMVGATGSMLASEQDNLFPCVTYTAGVSGSCWLQALYNSSLGNQKFEDIINHLKARVDTHIAYPPVALAALNSAPTNKYLLSGVIEKLKGDPGSNFGLVDIYGLLLSARLLVPEGQIGVQDADLKISNQRKYIEHGQNPMPIYTAVRHQISKIEESSNDPSEGTEAEAKKESWFQWFEMSPFEFFCEDFGAGIPTWAMGRRFQGGKNQPHDKNGYYTPELRLPLLLGIFGSAFCATLSHYYKEVRPLFRGFTGFVSIDELIEGRNEHLSKVHPIDPASIPNFVYKMDKKLPETIPEEVYKIEHIQLMDAGMSNNLPIYPLLRPGRDIDILIAFDASADIKAENWLSVADGYARQRGIKGWPVGAGWPSPVDTAEDTAVQLENAQASTTCEVDAKLNYAKYNEKEPLNQAHTEGTQTQSSQQETGKGDLSYCTVWVGRKEERSSSTDDVKSKAVKEDWELMEPDAGIVVIYFPFLSNPKVVGVNPETCEYMSTWNFVYTAKDIDNVVALARANFDEGKEKTKRCIRAVYERKKKMREDAENQLKWRRKVKLGIVGDESKGDHFHFT
ncbi:hypothetical protein K3495_g2236 [Podosphaera aphanis]|nr:hypothetical protein K3495_g2236 [Podosphaera aphanis]